MLIRPVEANDGKGGFSCGVPALDQFLAQRAWANEQLGLSRTYVLVDEAPDRLLLGFYTLSSKSIQPDVVAALYPKKLPRYQVPVLLIGMFAVTATRQLQGLGTVLIRDALARCLAASETVGALGVYLDSHDDKSTAFYKALGFTVVGATAQPQPMFLSMATLRQTIST